MRAFQKCMSYITVMLYICCDIENRGWGLIAPPPQPSWVSRNKGLRLNCKKINLDKYINLKVYYLATSIFKP